MKPLVLLPLLFFCSKLFAQYTVNGSAATNSCHCYTLTPNSFTKSGSVWNNNKINLTQSFDFNFDIYLGCSDNSGADGIAFVLQPISTSVGTTGGGLGLEGISPSVGVTVDTWENSEYNDPAYDHIAIQLNGNIDHSNSTVNIAGPVTAINGNDNIEDCQWHTLRIKWNAATNELTAYIDGSQRVAATKNFVADIFGGDPHVFWGFTGSTGGAANLQQFCTALSPKYTFLPNQKRCINEPVTFIDSTISFTAVLKRYWDFGDGSNIDSVNKNPVHTYTAAGNYVVKQTVIGADGCSETNTQTVGIAGKPVVAFKYTDSCEAGQIQFTDASTVPFGNINTWFWDAGNGTTSRASSFTTQFAAGGDKNIKLWVNTLEGCVSDTVVQQIHIYTRPSLGFTFMDSVCTGTTINFLGVVVNSTDPVLSWEWNFGDTASSAFTQNATYTYQTPGSRNVSFAATTTPGNGCKAMVSKPVFIRSKPVAAFKNNFICQSVADALIDSSYSADGAVISTWWWDLGNGQFSNLQNPTVTYNAIDTLAIKLVVQAGGCFSDTLTKPLMVAAKPIVDFGYSGNKCEDIPMQFSDSSKVQNGTVAQWLWVYQTAQWSSEQNPTKAFAAGNQTVSLSVVSDKGCKSGTKAETFFIIAKPPFTVKYSDACAGTTVNFTGTDISGGTIQQWLWDFGDNSTATVKDTTHIYATAGTFPVLLSVQAGNGCTATDSSFITIYSTNASAGADIIAAANQPIQLTATGGTSYEWSPADGLTNTVIANPVATNTEGQQYILRAYTPLGCDTYDTLLIKIYDGPEIYVPTAFNPSSRVGNSIFRVTAVGITLFKYFNVYNRFGQVVFTTTNPTQGWDGDYKGQPQPAGAYVWVTAGTTFRGNEILRKGTVVLVR